jgi:hypothetical protein
MKIVRGRDVFRIFRPHAEPRGHFPSVSPAFPIRQPTVTEPPERAVAGHFRNGEAPTYDFLTERHQSQNFRSPDRQGNPK